MSVSRPALAAFNAMEDEKARDRLLTCLDVRRWADDVLAGRPYDNVDRLESAMVAASATITDDELERALARHPRIGERADAAQHDAAHSTREQSGVDRADADVVRRIEEGNRAYDERFGRVFIFRAAGRSGQEILDQLRRRLEEGNRAYEERFGRVFNIRAAGRSGPEILDQLRHRLGNTDEAERTTTIDQLTQIAVLRMKEALS